MPAPAPQPDSSRPLTAKVRRFVEEFALHRNGARAARAAGFAARSAAVTASRLLRKANVQEALCEIDAEIAARSRITRDEILELTTRIAKLDPLRACDESGQLLPIHKMPVDVRTAIASMEIDEVQDRSASAQLSFALMDADGKPVPVTVRTRKVKFNDRLKALDLLGRHEKLWADELNVNLSDELLERLSAAREARRPGADRG